MWIVGLNYSTLIQIDIVSYKSVDYVVKLAYIGYKHSKKN